MAPSVEHPEADGPAQTTTLRDALAAIRSQCAALPRADRRTADEVIAYDAFGLPS